MGLRRHCLHLLRDKATLYTQGVTSVTDPYGTPSLAPASPAGVPETAAAVTVRAWRGRTFRKMADGSFLVYNGKVWFAPVDEPQEGQFLVFDDEPERRYRVAAYTLVREYAHNDPLRWDVWIE
jgi:hypothetical protein